MTRQQAAAIALRVACKRYQSTLFISSIKEPGQSPQFPNEWLIRCRQQNAEDERSDIVVALHKDNLCGSCKGIRYFASEWLRLF